MPAPISNKQNPQSQPNQPSKGQSGPQLENQTPQGEKVNPPASSPTPINTSTVEGSREPKALNGSEIVGVIAAMCAKKIRVACAGHQDLNEAKSFSKARIRFGFGLQIEAWPYDENRGVRIHAELDELNAGDFPADVLRILTGQQIWEQQVTATGEVIDGQIDPSKALENAVNSGYELPSMREVK